MGKNSVSLNFVLAGLSLAAGLLSQSSSAQSIVQSVGMDREQAMQKTACVQSLMLAPNTHRLSRDEFQVGKQWVCQKMMYLKASGEESSEDYTIQIPVSTDSVSYLFSKQGWGATNLEGSARGNVYGKTEYLAYSDGGLEGTLGIPYGVHNGFFWDFIRMTESGELVSEESVLYSDVEHFIVARNSPQALAEPKNKVFSYSVCKTVDAFRANPRFSCFAL